MVGRNHAEDRHTGMTEPFSNAGWSLALSEPGAFGSAAAIGHLSDWVEASVPGTSAGALAEAGRFDPDNPAPLHDQDIWYKCRFEADPGPYVLKIAGLATVAEIYVNEIRVLETASMFRSYETTIGLPAEGGDRNTMAICFRALEPLLAQKGPRARWKPRLSDSQGLRLVRTSLLGRMPGWCPEIHAVGPYRSIELVPVSDPRIEARSINTTLVCDTDWRLSVSAKLFNIEDTPYLVCNGQKTLMTKGNDGLHSGDLTLTSIKPWMPHTHGTPHLYDVCIETDGSSFPLGRTGFRSLDVDRGDDGKGFGLQVNGVNIFSRGAVWTNADLLNLGSDRNTYRPLLEAARDAGMNMLRVGGTMLYETRAFFELCDELGILVWQDFQFANYDYPLKDENFADEVRAEVCDQLLKTQGCPSLAILCGGSEIYQQGAMMGLPESRWKGELCETLLAGLATAGRPDVPYIPNSPYGGVLPFSPNEGVAHYYGVGAYLRPLEDARRAHVRFAGECLAFSNIPEQVTLDQHLPVKPGHDPRWKARVPRDRGVGWDFEDVRDHYLKVLFGVDPAALRYGDPDRYLDLGRAVTGEVMEQTFAEWRRKGSSCQGALVWTYQDLAAGAGWGVMDSTGRPKPAYYALKRAFRPLQVCVTDEGTNGLAVHIINELPVSKAVTLTLQCLKDGQVPVVSGQLELTLEPHSAQELNAVELIGAFFDVTYAYRFGPPSHDVTVVRLSDRETGNLLADAHHFPVEFDLKRRVADVEAGLKKDAEGNWQIGLETDRLLKFVHIGCDTYLPSENWFHLAPGSKKTIDLRPFSARDDLPDIPECRISALNARDCVTAT